jgi:hypothetical protein
MALSQQEKNEVEELGEEPVEEGPSVNFIPLTDRDIFNLAKAILLTCAIIFISFAVLRIIFCTNDGMKDVWDYLKIILNSIISLVLGLYFGKKGK